MPSYMLRHTPGAEDVAIEFRPIAPALVLGRYQHLLGPAFSSASLEAAARHAPKAAQPEAEAVLQAIVQVLNAACTRLTLYASWAAVPCGPDGAPMLGHLHAGQLGDDLMGLYAAVLEASGLGAAELESVRQLAEAPGILPALDFIGRRYGCLPSQLLAGLAGTPAGLALDVQAAGQGLDRDLERLQQVRQQPAQLQP
jgi:hypothetical protein